MVEKTNKNYFIYNNMKIISNEREKKITWTYKLSSIFKKRKNKNGEVKGTYTYSTQIPRALIEFIGIKDRTVFIYEKNGGYYLSSSFFDVEKIQKIKIQKTSQNRKGGQMSVPQSLFNLSGKNDGVLCEFSLDLNVFDEVNNVMGLCEFSLLF